MVKVKEKVFEFEVECDTCMSILEFNREDEQYHNGDRDSCCKELICPVCGSTIVVCDDYGYLIDKVKILRRRRNGREKYEY